MRIPVALGFAAVLLLGWGGSYAAHRTPGGDLAGPPFSDPAYHVPMPAEWLAQPIRYEDWAGTADLALSLDQHLYPVLLPHIEAFAERRGLKIAVQEGTCGISAGALLDKTIDMGGFCCPPAASDRLPGVRYHTVGIAPLALLVAAENPATGMSLADARKVFHGDYYRWNEIPSLQGGKPHATPLHPVTRLHCKARPGHWRLLLDHEDLFSPRVAEVGTIRDMMMRVAEDPAAIGYEVLWNIGRHQLDGKVRALDLDGFAANDAAALVRGDYPLYRTYNITTWEGARARPEMDALLAYLMEIVEREPLAIELVPPSELRAAGWRFEGTELVGERE